MQLTVVSEATVKQVLTLELAFDAVSRALTSVAEGHADIMPVVHADAAAPGAGFGVKTATDLSAGLLGLKVGSYFPANHARGIPNHGSTTLLLDAETGLPHALVSAGYLNGFRTAAANAVAVDALARPDASTLGVIGAGHQAAFEVRAVAHRRPISTVKVWSRNPASAEALCRELEDLDCTLMSVSSAEAAVRDSDIVTTVTTSRDAIVAPQWVAPGTHLSAMGADALGKQELDPALMTSALAFADLPAQSARIGEFQHAVTSGALPEAQIVPIGDVLLGRHAGRDDAAQITVFDSSGVAPQDLHVAHAVLGAARARDLCVELEF